MSTDHPLNNRLLTNKLLRLRSKDYSAFMQMIFEVLSVNTELAVADAASKESKLIALDSMLKHYEELEDYATCKIIKDLKERIENVS